LITLAIIGIIAAITIPTIKQSAERSAATQRIQKNFNTLSSAVNIAIAEHGEVISWDLPEIRDASEADRVFKKYFAPNLNLLKYCGVNTGCWTDTTYTYFNNKPYKNLDTIDDRTKAILQDGTLLSFRTGQCANAAENKQNAECGAFYVDINGFQKPNQIGRDVFEFWLYPDGLALPYSKGDATRTAQALGDEWVENNCLSAGYACATKIAREGWKITYW